MQDLNLLLLKNFYEKMENYKMKTWREVMSVNLDSVFLLSQIVSKYMIKIKVVQ